MSSINDIFIHVLLLGIPIIIGHILNLRRFAQFYPEDARMLLMRFPYFVLVTIGILWIGLMTSFEGAGFVALGLIGLLLALGPSFFLGALFVLYQPFQKNTMANIFRVGLGILLGIMSAFYIFVFFKNSVGI